MIRRFTCFGMLIILWTVQVDGKEWSFIPSPHDDAESQNILIKGARRTYYKADDYSFSATGPGQIRIITRWVGSKPASRDTSYSVYVYVGSKRHHKKYSTVRSAVAGIRGSRLWVGESRTLTLQLPSSTASIRVKSPTPNVFVRVLISKKTKSYGKLRSMSPDTYAHVVRLERNERERKYYRATAENPVELDIIGPTTLVIYSRLEFTYDMKGLQNYGVQIWEGSDLLHAFAWSTSRSDVTRYIDRDDLVPSPGQKIVIPVAKCAHRWTIRPAGGLKSILIRFLIPERDL